MGSVLGTRMHECWGARVGGVCAHERTRYLVEPVGLARVHGPRQGVLGKEGHVPDRVLDVWRARACQGAPRPRGAGLPRRLTSSVTASHASPTPSRMTWRAGASLGTRARTHAAVAEAVRQAPLRQVGVPQVEQDAALHVHPVHLDPLARP